jgi:hypothetical protein
VLLGQGYRKNRGAVTDEYGAMVERWLRGERWLAGGGRRTRRKHQLPKFNLQTTEISYIKGKIDKNFSFRSTSTLLKNVCGKSMFLQVGSEEHLTTLCSLHR